jgi:hypothetical protein
MGRDLTAVIAGRIEDPGARQERGGGFPPAFVQLDRVGVRIRDTEATQEGGEGEPFADARVKDCEPIPLRIGVIRGGDFEMRSESANRFEGGGIITELGGGD